MTEIAMRDEHTAVAVYTDNAMDRLGRWLQQADAVFAIAQKVCGTSFAPAAYRGKPDEAAAAMLAGAELGFDPMASLRAFDSINGVPAPKAVTLRAVTLGAGHEVEIVESTAQRAEVRGRRNGKGEWQTSVWDIARAGMLPQFKTNANYKNNPAAMLVARATAEVCRWVASDALMGMPYAAEEIADQPALAPSPAPARRLTMADLDEQPAVSPAEETRTPEWVPSDDEPMTEKQRGQMFALWGELEYGDNDVDRASRLKITARILGLESLETSAGLTQAEADRVIAALKERKRLRDGGDQ